MNNKYSNKILGQIQLHWRTNNAHPWPGTSAENILFVRMVLPLHISFPEQSINFLLPGYTIAKSIMLADIVVFSLFRLKNAT